MTKATAEFLLRLVGELTLSVGADDFDDALPRVLQAREELRAEIDVADGKLRGQDDPA